MIGAPLLSQMQRDRPLVISMRRMMIKKRGHNREHDQADSDNESDDISKMKTMMGMTMVMIMMMMIMMKLVMIVIMMMMMQMMEGDDDDDDNASDGNDDEHHHHHDDGGDFMWLRKLSTARPAFWKQFEQAQRLHGTNMSCCAHWGRALDTQTCLLKMLGSRQLQKARDRNIDPC